MYHVTCVDKREKFSGNKPSLSKATVSLVEALPKFQPRNAGLLIVILGAAAKIAQEPLNEE